MDLTEKLNKNSKKIIFKEDYLLGEDYCELEQEDALYILRLIEMSNSDLNCMIRSDIEGTLVKDGLDVQSVLRGTDFEGTDISIYNNQLTLYTLWLSKGNKGSLNDFLDCLLKDCKDDWKVI